MSVLPDVLASGLSIVFCGSAVGVASARRQAYYAGPGNAFWPTLAEVGLTSRLLAPEEYKSITKHGLGLTDLAKTISGSDKVLTAKHFDRNALRAKMLRYHPRVLAFTSKRAAQEFIMYRVDYGLLDETIGETMLFVLPSPSGAARRYWNKKHWRELARLRDDDMRLVNSPCGVDRKLLLRFFLDFARFEHALKASGRFKQHPETDQPYKEEPDWDTFAESLRDTFDAAGTEQLAQACAYLRDSPPNRQVIVSGEVAWETPLAPAGETDVQFLLQMVRVVRNNLFHSAKHNLAMHEDVPRTELLLRSSLSILEACLSIAPRQRSAYMDARL